MAPNTSTEDSLIEGIVTSPSRNFNNQSRFEIEPLLIRTRPGPGAQPSSLGTYIIDFSGKDFSVQRGSRVTLYFSEGQSDPSKIDVHNANGTRQEYPLN